MAQGKADTPRKGTARRITRYGDPVLHRRCREVTSYDDDLERLVADMFASMYAAEGVGLAANQIGVDARVFVLDCPDADGTNVVAHVVNPVLLLPERRELVVEPEGCLSVPEQSFDVPRAEAAEITGVDTAGRPVTIVGTGLLSRCLQHEYDHLEGVVYVDRLPRRHRKRLLADSADHPGVGFLGGPAL
jgi:peptide deformylase